MYKFIFRLPYALVQWAAVSAIKFALIVIGLAAVPLSLVADGSKRTPKMWRLWGSVEEVPNWWLDRLSLDNWYTKIFPNFWWMAIRNPLAGSRYIFNEPAEVKTYGEPEIENGYGFQWRYRHSTYMDSFRCTWGEPRSSKGKREFYIGWKLGSSTPGLGFALSLRPF